MKKTEKLEKKDDYLIYEKALKINKRSLRNILKSLAKESDYIISEWN